MLKRCFNNIKKLNTKLLICTITPMVIILVLAAGTSIRAITGAITQLSLQQLRTEAASSCDQLNSFLSKYMIAISSESSSYILERYMKTLTMSNNPKTNPYYFQLMDTLDTIYGLDPENIAMVWVADFDSGVGIGNTDSGWMKIENQWHITKRPWYQQSLDNQTAFISDPYISLYDDTPVVSLIIPIQDTVNKRGLGVLSMDLRLDSIQSLVESVSTESNAMTIILDSQNQLVSHPDKSKLLQPVSNNGKLTWLDNKSGSRLGLFEFLRDKKTFLGYASVLKDTSWTMIVMIEKTFITQNLLPLILQILAIFILSIILFALIVSAFSRMITMPLEEVTNATKEIAKGNYALHLISNSHDEVGQLAKAADITIQTLRSKAMFDSLTGIYNEFAFSSEATQLIQSHPERQYVIVRFDISRFKMVNDMFGKQKGDDLLKFIAAILHDHISPEDCYGRIGGDVFCICTKESAEKDIFDLIYRITYHVEAFPINFRLTPYFGICLVNPEVSLSTLLDWSGLALKTVKGSNLTNYAFYNNQMREKLLEESRIENEMDNALEGGQFVVHLQPKCNIETSKVVGAEALVRWIHPETGVIPPDLFIPLFEKNGFIVQLDEYIWEETCKILHSWQEKGYPLVPVSVNISRVHIFDPGFCDKITSLIQKYKIPIQMLELEFTESAFVSNLNELYHIMALLKERGFTLSMDDFGSGYSSLNMLKSSPVNVIKIDKEFFNESTCTESGRVIMQNTISMLRQLKMQIVAEGVETKEQASFLLASGCSTAQGYYYSKPINISSFEEFANLKQV